MDSPTAQTPDLTPRPAETGLAATSRAKGMTSAPRRGGPFAPRLLLLAAIVYHPTILIAYLLYVYSSSACVAGTLCTFGSYPALVQALALLAGCALLWLAIYLLVYRLIEAPGGGSVAGFLRELSAYPLIGPLLRLYGFVLLVGLVLALLARHLTIPALVVGGFGAFVCFYCAGSRAEPTGSGGRA